VLPSRGVDASRRAIGMKGETILRSVLDQTGRAAEEARSRIEVHKNRPKDQGEVAFDLAISISSSGLLSSSTANEGEDFLLAMDRLISAAAQRAITEIEAAEEIGLTDEQRQAIHDLAAVAIGATMEFEEADKEAKQPAQPRLIHSPDGSVLDTSTGRVTLTPDFKG